ncbi:MAG: RDD family protein [Chloroflexota bacterium]|nr:RDD family protein [Chloroflexota bacterium]MDE2959744.1 RDD family protein [Chloroflexota bacterium]
MAVNRGVIYAEPGEQPDPATGSEQVSAAANPVARLFARVINGVLLFFLTCCFWLVTFIVIGVAVARDLASNLWPRLSELTVGDASDAGDVIEDTLSEYWETYSVAAAVSDAAIVILVPLGAALLAIVLRLLYLTFMVRFAGGDFGHLVLGLRVVNYGDGRRPSFGQALGRALLKQLDGLIVPWLVNSVMVLIAPERRHLYDIAANTMVVRGRTVPRATEAHTRSHTELADAPQLTGNRAIPLPPSPTD